LLLYDFQAETGESYILGREGDRLVC